MIDFKNKAKIYLFIFVWIAYTVLHFVSVFSVMNEAPLSAIIIHSVVRSFLLGVLVILLNIILAFGNYELLAVFQRVINCVVLFVLMASAWLGLGYILDYISIGYEVAAGFLPLYPFYGLIVLLFFMIVLLLNISKKSAEKEEDTVENDDFGNEEKNNNEETELIERVAVKSGQKIHVILVGDIVFLQADGDYVQIHTKDGRFLKEQTMKYFQERLSWQQFVRVHRSVIVNVEQISRIELFEKQNQQLTLKNGERIKMSAAGYKTLREVLGL